MNTYTGTLFIISAASGSGKTSLVKALVNKINNLVLSISHTTRTKRAAEQDGIDYFFISKETFLEMQHNNQFLESAIVFNNYYGTSKQFVLDQLKLGRDIILEIDYQGALKIKDCFSQLNHKSIFILPPSLQSLTERLNSRGQDDFLVIQQRINNAKIEIQHYLNYDYLIINDNFDKAIEDLSTIIYAERLTVNKQKDIHANLINSLLT
jgi:guanylate kinase